MRGRAANGVRMTKKRLSLIAQGLADVKDFVKGTNDQIVVRPDFLKTGAVLPGKPVKIDDLPEDLDQNIPEAILATRMAERFDILEQMTGAAIRGDIRSLIVSGPGGVGKSYQVETALKEADPAAERHVIVKGFLRPTGLYETLYQYRHKNNVVVFDDADAVFYDDVALNLLKAVCDTSEKRFVSWLSKGQLTVDGELVPKTFEFEGTVIFISNLDFDTMIERGTKLAPHLQALCSRSLYVNMEMKTRRHCLIRIRQVMRNGMLDNLGLNGVEQEEVLSFIDANLKQLRELSLRTAIKVAQLRKSVPGNWENLAKVSCLK
eukprot:gnl/Spiro4/25177_TR12527_c0_g3_i1.p2 gnl/Spiro4/25177_TR12527_c0_g3~~gnl/Spiro4/25177_TR12527_c0_g3_i1.p2  ORF type:complete len:320 (+),score=49.87 gnl/Spiro4/25177_TR12527_c0_g3_i1:1420-2379(+)